MKLISNNILAASVTGGSAAGLSALDVGAGWSLFAFNTKLPTSKEGFDAAFDNRSLADMYNTSAGLVRSPIVSVDSGNVISLNIQSWYIPKGVSYFGPIGTAKTMASQLLPDRIIRTPYTDRSINLITSALVGSATVGAASYMMAGNVLDFEFDTAVTITHLKAFDGTVWGAAPAFNLFRLSDDGTTETAITISKGLAGDGTIVEMVSPVAAKRYRLKPVGINTVGYNFAFLSTVNMPSSDVLPAPKWVALAHCNTLTHGDIDYSDSIMFTASAIGPQGPFKLTGDIIPNQKNLMYCPKLRFTQRSN